MNDSEGCDPLQIALENKYDQHKLAFKLVKKHCL